MKYNCTSYCNYISGPWALKLFRPCAFANYYSHFFFEIMYSCCNCALLQKWFLGPQVFIRCHELFFMCGPINLINVFFSEIWKKWHKIWKGLLQLINIHVLRIKVTYSESIFFYWCLTKKPKALCSRKRFLEMFVNQR